MNGNAMIFIFGDSRNHRDHIPTIVAKNRQRDQHVTKPKKEAVQIDESPGRDPKSPPVKTPSGT